MVKTTLVPPDGGWGWMIVGAYGLNYLVAVPIMQCFGLLFKDTFAEKGFTATDISLIMTTNAALSMFWGFINGPLINKFGSRKVALGGAVLITVGMFLTAYAETFTQYFIFYGLIASIGIGIGFFTYPIAVNTYFVKKRSLAAGYSMAISGFGPILMPQVISFLLGIYDVKGSVIILTGIAAHSFVCAVLLQPTEWHMKREVVEDDTDALEKDKLIISVDENGESTSCHQRTASSRLSLREEIEIEAKYAIDTPLAGSLLSLSPAMPLRTISVSSRKDVYTNLKSTNEDLEPEDEENEKHKALKDTAGQNNDKKGNNTSTNVYDTNLSVDKKIKSLRKRIAEYLVKTFDLTLLKDFVFVNIVVGMSLAVFAEMTFSLLTPFIIEDYGLSTQEIATFMSTQSVVDICFRFLAPYIGNFFNKPSRIMYMWALALLILSRSSLLLTTNHYLLLGCAAFLGVAKGFRTVYWTLVIPDYVPIERIATALGMYAALNGIFVWIGGPLFGVIKDITGSYKNCIIVTNCVSFTTITMWIIEFIIVRLKSRKKPIDVEVDVKLN